MESSPIDYSMKGRIVNKDTNGVPTTTPAGPLGTEIGANQSKSLRIGGEQVMALRRTLDSVLTAVMNKKKTESGPGISHCQPSSTAETSTKVCSANGSTECSRKGEAAGIQLQSSKSTDISGKVTCVVNETDKSKDQSMSNALPISTWDPLIATPMLIGSTYSPVDAKAADSVPQQQDYQTDMESISKPMASLVKHDKDSLSYLEDLVKSIQDSNKDPTNKPVYEFSAQVDMISASGQTECGPNTACIYGSDDARNEPIDGEDAGLHENNTIGECIDGVEDDESMDGKTDVTNGTLSNNNKGDECSDRAGNNRTATVFNSQNLVNRPFFKNKIGGTCRINGVTVHYIVSNGQAVYTLIELCQKLFSDGGSAFTGIGISMLCKKIGVEVRKMTKTEAERFSWVHPSHRQFTCQIRVVDEEGLRSLYRHYKHHSRRRKNLPVGGSIHIDGQQLHFVMRGDQKMFLLSEIKRNLLRDNKYMFLQLHDTYKPAMLSISSKEQHVFFTMMGRRPISTSKLINESNLNALNATYKQRKSRRSSALAVHTDDTSAGSTMYLPFVSKNGEKFVLLSDIMEHLETLYSRSSLIEEANSLLCFQRDITPQEAVVLSKLKGCLVSLGQKLISESGMVELRYRMKALCKDNYYVDRHSKKVGSTLMDPIVIDCENQDPDEGNVTHTDSKSELKPVNSCRGKAVQRGAKGLAAQQNASSDTEGYSEDEPEIIVSSDEDEVMPVSCVSSSSSWASPSSAVDVYHGCNPVCALAQGCAVTPTVVQKQEYCTPMPTNSTPPGRPSNAESFRIFNPIGLSHTQTASDFETTLCKEFDSDVSYMQQAYNCCIECAPRDSCGTRGTVGNTFAQGSTGMNNTSLCGTFPSENVFESSCQYTPGTTCCGGICHNVSPDVRANVTIADAEHVANDDVLDTATFGMLDKIDCNQPLNFWTRRTTCNDQQCCTNTDLGIHQPPIEDVNQLSESAAMTPAAMPQQVPRQGALEDSDVQQPNYTAEDFKVLPESEGMTPPAMHHQFSRLAALQSQIHQMDEMLQQAKSYNLQMWRHLQGIYNKMPDSAGNSPQGPPPAH